MGLNLLITINAATLITLVICGYKIITFINNIEFKTDILWGDYEYRVLGRERRQQEEDNDKSKRYRD